jgi:hypothetical protein
VVEHRRINIMIQNSEEGGELGVVVNDYTRDFEYHSFANGVLRAWLCVGVVGVRVRDRIDCKFRRRIHVSS